LYKASHATATILWSIVLPTWVLIIPNSSITVLCSGCRGDAYYRRGENLCQKWPLDFAYYYLYCISRSLTCRKNLTTWGWWLYFPPKEVVRRILSPLNVHCSQLGLNPWTLGPMASMINIIPPRMTNSCVKLILMTICCIFFNNGNFSGVKVKYLK
jgi:hypothetical protein